MNTTVNDRPLFSRPMKMADLADGNYLLLGVLSRVGIRFGFGEATVEEVCTRYGVDPDTFLLICNVYAFDGYLPSGDVLRRADLRNIVKYLHRSHAYYMDNALAGLADDIERLIAPCDDRRKQVIRKFFTDYKEELARHFAYEENIVFPYVDAVLNHLEDKNFTITQYEENHTNVEEKLSDLKRIVMKYLPAECDSQVTNRVLLQIHLLEKDLEKHTLIEDDILVPIVNNLEKNGR